MSEQDPVVEPQATGQGSGDSGQAPKTFSEEYVKELRAEAAKYRTQRGELREQLSNQGDYDDIKAAADKWQAQQEKDKSALDKLQEQVATLEKERDNALVQTRTSLIQSAFVAGASKAGYANPQDVYHLAEKSDVIINDAGEVEGVEEAIKAVGDRLPKAKQTAPPLDGGAGGAAKGSGTQYTMAELRQQAVRMGVDPVLYAAEHGVKLE